MDDGSYHTSHGLRFRAFNCVDKTTRHENVVSKRRFLRISALTYSTSELD